MTNLSDAAAERAVLASVCAFGTQAFFECADLLTAKSFTDPTHQAIWACCSTIFAGSDKAEVDYPSILSAAKGLGVISAFQTEADKSVLRSVLVMPVKLQNTRLLAGKLLKLQFARDALVVVDQVKADLNSLTGDEPIQDIVSRIEGPVLDIASLLTESHSGPKAVGSGLRAFAQHLADNKREVVGLSSGYRLYDRAIGGGFRPGTVNVIGARPKIGKSLLATNIAVRVASGAGYNWPQFGATGVPVLQLDTEMTREDQWVRQMACVSGVDINDIETGKYASDPVKCERVGRAIEAIENWPYDFDSIAGQPFDATEAAMRRWVTKRVGLNDDGSAKPCLIVFDYLKLMDSSSMEAKNLAEFQVLGFMMTRLHNFAVKYKVPILTFIQLNRDGINTEDTSAASGSDRIVWLCSNFSIYKKKSDEEVAEQAGSRDQWNRKLVPIVARHGAGLDDGDYINVMSHGSRAQIAEGPTRSQVKQGVSEPSGPRGIVVEASDDQEPVQLGA